MLTIGGIYSSVFNGCTSLTTLPKVISGKPESISNIFYNMFKGCTSIVNGIELIDLSQGTISSLASDMFRSMFQNCTNLLETPTIKLPSTLISIGADAFREMYNGCTNLIKANNIIIENSQLETINNESFYQMFNDCTSLITGPKFNIYDINNPISTIGTYVFYRTFYNCTSLTGGIDYLPNAARIKDQCYRETFRNCTSLIQTPQFTNLDIINYIENRGVNSTFNNCTSITSGIELPSAALGNRMEYYYLYEKCNSLNYVKVNFTAWKGNSTQGWFANNTSKNGTFVCPAALPQTRGVNNIPNGWTIHNPDGGSDYDPDF